MKNLKLKGLVFILIVVLISLPQPSHTATRTVLGEAAGGVSGLWLKTGNDIYYLSGDVGIGTIPTNKLEIVDNVNIESSIQNTSGSGFAHFTAAAGVTQSALLAVAGSSGGVGTYTDHDFTIFINSAEKVRVTTDGDVGIGTTPDAANNGVEARRGNGFIAGTVSYAGIVTEMQFTVGDAVTLRLFQSTGSAQTVNADNKWTYLVIRKID